MDNKQFRTLSREQLGNNVFRNRWITMMAICVTAIFTDTYLMAIAPFTGFLIGPVFAVIVGGPLLYGAVKASLECAEGERWSFTHVLHGFLDCFGGSIILGFLKWLFLTAWTMLLLVPGWAIAYGIYLLIGDLFQSIAWTVFLWTLFGLWTGALAIPGAIKSYEYAFAFHIQCGDVDKEAIDCLTESQRLMNGRKWELFKLDVSFVGWYLLGGLCLGVGALFVIPYHEMARTNFYKSLKDKYDQEEIEKLILEVEKTEETEETEKNHD